MQVKRTLTIVNKLGLHARAATQLVKLAQQFNAQIILQKDGKTASADSVLGLMMLEGSQNKKVDVVCDGADAAQAMEAVSELFSQRFNESE